MNSAYIGNLTIRSTSPVIVYGSVRGLISEHKTVTGAEASLRKDQKGCRSQGGYSDARVYEWSESEGWELAAPSDI